LQEYSGAIREAIVLAEEALLLAKLRLDNFNQDIKLFTKYCHIHFNIGSGGQISHSHWIRIHNALEEAYTETFRLHITNLRLKKK
jgi:hypothetical protein